MSKICKWGNSLGLRMPSAVAKVAGLKRGSPVIIRLLDNGTILVTPTILTSVEDGQRVTAKVKPATTVW
jgi:antitoxin MazE